VSSELIESLRVLAGRLRNDLGRSQVAIESVGETLLNQTQVGIWSFTQLPIYEKRAFDWMLILGTIRWNNSRTDRILTQSERQILLERAPRTTTQDS
jgi:hypothetical protein